MIRLLFYSFLIFIFACTRQPQERENDIVIVVHGGAGNFTEEMVSEAMEQKISEEISSALNRGYSILEEGGSSVKAVEAAVSYLEDSPFFNAGRGAVQNEYGEYELDASVMEGKNLNAGAVAAVSGVKNPVHLAARVMDSTSHVLLVADGAEQFAEEQGVEMEPHSYFSGAEVEEEPGSSGTVGAVALDKNGVIAAATSTGGLSGKMKGRVGDTPLPGAGTYASVEGCAVSCTGAGEFFIRTNAAKEVSELVHLKDVSLTEAADIVLDKIRQMGGSGGMILLDRRGNYSVQFNTSGMIRGIKAGENTETALF